MASRMPRIPVSGDGERQEDFEFKVVLGPMGRPYLQKMEGEGLRMCCIYRVLPKKVVLGLFVWFGLVLPGMVVHDLITATARR